MPSRQDPPSFSTAARTCWPRFYPDWDLTADMTVDVLRTEAGRNPHDKDLHDLVGELSTKRFHHPVVGDLTLAWHGTAVGDEPGLTLRRSPAPARLLGRLP